MILLYTDLAFKEINEIGVDKIENFILPFIIEYISHMNQGSKLSVKFLSQYYLSYYNVY